MSELGTPAFMIMKWYPILVLVSKPGETEVLCMYFRPECATWVTSLELLQQGTETPTRYSCPQPDNRGWTCNIYTDLQKVHRNIASVQEGNMELVVSIPCLSQLLYMTTYMKLTMTDFKHNKLQGQVTVNIVHNLSSLSSKCSSAHRQNKIHSLALNSWGLHTFF